MKEDALQLIETIEGECQEAKNPQENYNAEDYIDSILEIIKQFKEKHGIE